MSEKKESKYKYHYLFFLLVVVITWGVVPGLAKISGLPGDVTTLHVNWIATLAVAGLITIQKKWAVFRNYGWKDYFVMVAIGLVWPLAYSVAYFNAVVSGGPALTTILNYTWPVFCLLFSKLVNKKKDPVPRWPIILAVAAAIVPCLWDNAAAISLLAPAMVFGLFAAASQGFYSAATDRWTYDAWVMTFIVEVVTAVGSGLLVWQRGSFVWPTLPVLGYMAIIGAVSNGIGFWAFLAGSQNSGQNGFDHKAVWLIGMCLIPLAQVLWAVAIGAQTMTAAIWVGLGLIMASLLLQKIVQMVNEKKAKT